MGFKLNMNADVDGTSLQGHVMLKHADIVAVFGLGDDCGDKTTQEWVFQSDTGEVFCLYDWKQRETPTEEYHWHIGASRDSNLEEFVAWLTKTVRG